MHLRCGQYGLLLAVGFGLAAVGCCTTPAFTADSEDGFLTANTAAMNKMMAGMAIKPTGDVDHDFVGMMVPHHQGAIDMAQAELLYGHNQQLLRIAQGIVVEQLQEIAAMRLAIGEPASPTWETDASHAAVTPVLPQTSGSGRDASFLRQTNTAMNKMMAGMAVKSTGDIDHDFVAMMVPHHQGAIDMAEAELQYGHNSKLKAISQEIIVDQTQEITLMRLAVGEGLPASASSPTQVSSSEAQPSALPASGASQKPVQMSPAMHMAPTKPAASE